MKLTAEQMFILRDACEARAEQCLKHSHLAAADSTAADYWKQEAAAVHQLALLFKDAMRCEVETVILEPATPATAAGQTTAAAPPAASSPYPAAVAQALDASLLPEEEFAGHLQSLQTKLLHGTAEGSPSAALEGWSDQDLASAASLSSGPVHLPALESTLPGVASPTPPSPSHSSAESAVAESPAPQPSSLRHSSPQSGEACGDINCDGHCPPPGMPRLIWIIDQAPTVHAARIMVASATESARRLAARFLRTDLHELPEAIIRRVRERLLKNL